MNIKSIAVGLTALVVGTGAASAATETFNLSGSDSTSYGSLSNALAPITQGGLTATFSAGSFTNGPNGVQNVPGGYTITSGDLASDPHIGRYGGGAGVVNSSGDNDHQVDGNGWRDFIQVVFSQAVSLTEVDFSFFGSNDNMRWMYDMNDNGSIGVGDFVSFSTASDPFTGFGSVKSKVWGIMAFDSNDEWKVKSVTASYDDPPAVPLPAAGWMLLAGVAGMAGLRRRKKS